jgi:Family of unknown function (DUF6527)
VNFLKLNFWRFWYLLRKLIWKDEIPRFAKYVSELPDNLSDDFIYVVGENGFQWFVALNCPCKCGDFIHLNLLTEARPCWEIERHSDLTLSVKPSVWSLKGCGSHYFIKAGKIKWC